MMLGLQLFGIKKKKKPVLIWEEKEGKKDKNVPGKQFWNSVFLDH